LLLGAGTQDGTVRKFITMHRLNEVVATPGVVDADELPRWFRAAKGYISCSRSDGTSVSLLEAMATGLPVVVSDVAANREWVTDGENGWLVPAGARQQLAERLLKVATLSHAERGAIAKRNQEVVAVRADWDKNFPHLLDLYDRLVRAAAKVAG
jgi:glycosyltransferase involved in cell wall biosynthesis